MRAISSYLNRGQSVVIECLTWRCVRRAAVRDVISAKGMHFAFDEVFGKYVLDKQALGADQAKDAEWRAGDWGSRTFRADWCALLEKLLA